MVEPHHDRPRSQGPESSRLLAGRSIACLFEGLGSGDQVFIAAADGSSPPVRIGNPETVNWAPIFSPDGSKIMYFEGQEGEHIAVMNPDGSS